MSARAMKKIVISIAAVALTACGGKAFQYRSQNEIPVGPGLLTGEEGAFVLHRSAPAQTPASTVAKDQARRRRQVIRTRPTASSRRIASTAGQKNNARRSTSSFVNGWSGRLTCVARAIGKSGRTDALPAPEARYSERRL